jgi:hypothetical protein
MVVVPQSVSILLNAADLKQAVLAIGQQAL